MGGRLKATTAVMEQQSRVLRGGTCLAVETRIGESEFSVTNFGGLSVLGVLASLASFCAVRGTFQHGLGMMIALPPRSDLCCSQSYT